MRLPVTRKENTFSPDFRKVILRYFDNGPDRTIALVEKIISMPEKEAHDAFVETLREFSRRHRNITRRFQQNYEMVKNFMQEQNIPLGELSAEKKMLLGSFFSLEYSVESAAFFNPSIVESPDQTGLEEGSKRIIVSFRATGEGHISSIVFHTGVIDSSGEMHFEKGGRFIEEALMVKRKRYKKSKFCSKLEEMKLPGDVVRAVMDQLNDIFIYGELVHAVKNILRANNQNEAKRRAAEEIMWLADSHYELTFSRDTHINERVIFPISFAERKGIEDARFVKFTHNNGKVVYYATYTAFDGVAILPKLIQTTDFYHFKVKPLHGTGAQNKNLALFPRKINGKYAMLSRIDGINSYIGFSDNINIWGQPILLQSPRYHWEYVQIGNCGSPIETSEGWLVITHGVGPVRRYCLGASLLDLEDPTREIGRLKEPLLAANETEREGYVPNVVYSCGSIIHNRQLFVPYGMSDTSSGFISVDMDELLNRLKKGG